MKKIPIQFFLEDISFNLLNKQSIRSWISDVIIQEGYTLEDLCFIFCSDSYLNTINKDYLNHDDYTDIITFDNRMEGSHSKEKLFVLGDIFISYQRVKENAGIYKIPIKDELHRVIVHGVLHLLGYKDKTPKDKTLMTQKEDYYLLSRKF